MFGVIVTLQLNEDDVESSADDVNDHCEEPAVQAPASLVRVKKKKKKKAKDKSSNDPKAVVLYSFLNNL